MNVLVIFDLSGASAPVFHRGNRASHARPERTQRQRDEAVDGAREVLVGNKISPGNPVTKPDGHGVVTGVCRGYNRAGGAAHPHSNIN